MAQPALTSVPVRARYLSSSHGPDVAVPSTCAGRTAIVKLCLCSPVSLTISAAHCWSNSVPGVRFLDRGYCLLLISKFLSLLDKLQRVDVSISIAVLYPEHLITLNSFIAQFRCGAGLRTRFSCFRMLHLFPLCCFVPSAPTLTYPT